jgi:hypothetical protein
MQLNGVAPHGSCVKACAVLTFFSLSVSASSLALAWGHPRHQYVGAIADELLAYKKNASTQVKAIIGMPLRLAIVSLAVPGPTQSAPKKTFRRESP